MLQCIFNLVLWGMIVMAEDTYNFPLQLNQPNTMFLEDYTSQKFQVPLYQLDRNNEFNLSIQQSALLLQEGKLDSNGKIISASNYISASQLDSNNFLILTKNNLYKGLLDSNGNLNLNLVPVNFVQLSCFYINLITESMGMISCLKNNYLNFVIANYSNSQNQIYATNFTFPKTYSNRKINLQYVNENTFYIYLTYVTKDNASVISFSYNQQQIQQISQQVYNGTYIQAVLSQDFNYLFLMSKKSIYLINLQTNNSLREIANYKTIIHRVKEHFTKMAAYQISNNIFHIVLLQNKYLSQLYIDTQVKYQTENKQHLTLNSYKKVIQLQVNINSIYVVTNNYMIKLDSIKQIKPTNYLNSSVNMALIQFERQIAILIDTNEQSTKFQSILFNKPQIQINLNQTQQIAQNLQSVKLRIKIISQLQREIEDFLLLNIVITDIAESQCPISFSNDFPTANLIYPQVQTIKGNQMMLGPNITTVITSSDKNYLTIQKSNIKKYISKSTGSFSAICTLYRTNIITCSQHTSEIRISYSQSLQLDKTSTYFVIPLTFNQTLIQCTCSQTILEIEIVMQFTTYVLIQTINYQLQQQGLYQYSFNQQILSSAFLEQTLFVITDDNILSAYSKNNLKTPKFSVENYQFNQIYLNLQNYPNYLFIDNQQNIIILSYNGYSSYQFVNQIAYPQLNYDQIKLGILNNGIYIALINQQKNVQLYYYPIQSMFINSSIQTYYELNLLGYQFAFSNLQTAYTQRHFYIILYKSTSVYWAQYYGSGSSFVSLIQSNWIQTISTQNYISSISVVEYEQEQQEIEYLQICNTNQDIKKYIITDWSVALIPQYKPNQLSVQTQVQYNSSNLQCSNLQQQDVTIIYEKKVILPRLYDSEKNIVELQMNQTQFQLNPLELFNGNIDNYTATCNNCQQFNYTQPTSDQNQIELNIISQGLTQLNETFLYIQNNISVYLVEIQTGQLTKLYDFPQKMTACYTIFVELVTQFPFSICSDSKIYSYNLTSQIIMQYDLSYLSSLYLKYYNNGILQIICYSNNVYQNYYQFYVQIQDNQIILNQIYSYLRFQSVYYIDQVIVKLSSNFTSDPCQILGFSQQIQSYVNPKFFILKTCMPSSIAQYFGFPGNKYNEITNIYFQISEWMLIETQVISVVFSTYIQQVGLPISINDQVSQLIISCPYANNIKTYRIQFNQTDGKIIGFQFSGQLYFEFSQVYQFTTSNNMIIIFLLSKVNNNSTINLYFYNVEDLFYSNMQIIPYISLKYSMFTSEYIFTITNGDYFLMSGFTENRSLILKLQNSLIFNVSLQVDEEIEIEIIAQNQQSQSKRSLFVKNEQNDNDDENDDNNNDENDETDENDDDNDDNNNKNKKLKLRLIIIIAISILLLIIIIVIVILCCKKKEDKKQSNEMSYQLV